MTQDSDSQESSTAAAAASFLGTSKLPLEQQMHNFRAGHTPQLARQFGPVACHRIGSVNCILSPRGKYFRILTCHISLYYVVALSLKKCRKPSSAKHHLFK